MQLPRQPESDTPFPRDDDQIVEVVAEPVDPQRDIVEVCVEPVELRAPAPPFAPAPPSAGEINSPPHSAVEAVALLLRQQAKLAAERDGPPPERPPLAGPAPEAGADPGANEKLAGLEERLGYRFRDRRTLRHALVHSSSSQRPHDDNERMEFLGDAVLDLVIREYCFHQYPDRQEGELTEAKSAVVCRASLAKAARHLGLQYYLLLGRDLGKRPKIPDSLVADAYEAVVAALYLDGGYAPARRFIMDTLGADLARALAGLPRIGNPKSLLQQLVQSQWRTTPQYATLAQHGPEHSRVFEVAVLVGEAEISRGRGASKKDAEQDAARRALALLQAEKRGAAR